MSKVSLSAKAGIITFGDSLKYIVTLALGICLVRIFSKETYGTFQQVFLVIWTTTGLIMLGLPGSLLYFLPQLSKEKKEVLVKQTLITLFLIGFIFTLVIFIASNQISVHFNNPPLVNLLKIFSLFILPTLGSAAFGPIMIYSNKHKIFASYTVITSIIYFAIVIGLALAGYGLAQILTGILVLAWASFAFVLFYINKQIRFISFSWNINILKNQLKYAIPLGLSGMLGYLGKQLDKFIIAMFFLAGQYAVYNVGAIEIPIVMFLIASVDSVALPKIVEFYKNGEIGEIIKLWHEMIRKVSMIILPIFIYCLILAPQIITLLYTENYSAGAAIFRIYLLILPLRLARFSVLLQAMGKSKLVLKGAILFLILNTLLNIAFIHTIGFTGPAWATLIAISSLLVFYAWCTKKNLNLKVRNLYPWNTLFKLSGYAAVSGICIYPLTFIVLPKILVIGLSGILYLIIYATLLYKTNFLTSVDIELIKKSLTLKVLYAK